MFVGSAVSETQALTSKLGLLPSVQWVGRVNYEESLRHIGSASVCVLVEANIAEGIYLPSKLMDYLVARKPVLALSPAVGVVADMATRGGILRADPNDVAAIVHAIEVLYADFMAGTLGRRAPDEGIVSEFTAPTVATKFLRVVAQLRGSAGFKAGRVLESMGARPIEARVEPTERSNEQVSSGRF